MVDWLTIYHLVLPFLQYQLQEPPNNLGSALDLFILRDTYGPNLFQGKGPSTIYNHLYISVSDNHPYEAFINSNLQPPKNSPKGLVDKIKPKITAWTIYYIIFILTGIGQNLFYGYLHSPPNHPKLQPIPRHLGDQCRGTGTPPEAQSPGAAERNLIHFHFKSIFF